MQRAGPAGSFLSRLPFSPPACCFVDTLLERQAAIGTETLQRWLLGLPPLAPPSAQQRQVALPASRHLLLDWWEAPFDVEGYSTALCEEGYTGPLCAVCAEGARRLSDSAHAPVTRSFAPDAVAPTAPAHC